MKCVICNGTVQEKIVEYKEFGVPLGRFPAKVCNSCGEEFFDSETVDKIQIKSKDKGLFGLAAKKTKVALVGNSLAVRIPKEIAEFVGLRKEGEIRVVPKNKHEIALEIA
ncbi:AbrB/MazE/SpoVT family DNA-binding domain-containing protein [Candidatus Woesearchaeota archaeon]|nr:AbrB/MazE/SpoVT family DNA-binding domain-containing protein [Candidatus Woesearchaeota archaeon]